MRSSNRLLLSRRSSKNLYKCAKQRLSITAETCLTRAFHVEWNFFPVIACDRVSRKHRQQTVLVAKLQARHSLPGLYGLQVILRSVAEPTVSVVPEHFLSGGKRQLFSTGEGLAQNCCCGKTHSSNHLHDRTE
jgi:hypothetical protein